MLAAAAFTYVTAELLPVGALPAIARDLHVSVPMVGTLLAWYALVAAVTTIPLVRWTAHWQRRRALLLSLACLTVSQLISALAPNFVVLAGGRALSAVTHGLILSVIAPIATRLVPASHSGRATTCIYVGISLAVVVGSPATAAMSLLWGWRIAVGTVAVVAAVVTVAAAAVLPLLSLSDEQRARVGRGAGHHRNRRLVIVSLLTMIAVTGHYISFTFIAVIIRDVVGIRGPDIAWLLSIYGIAGLLAMPLVARPLDHRPTRRRDQLHGRPVRDVAGVDHADLPPPARGGDRPGRRHCHRVVGCVSRTRCRPCCKQRRCAPAPTIPTARPACTWRPSKWASWPGHSRAASSTSTVCWRCWPPRRP